MINTVVNLHTQPVESVNVMYVGHSTEFCENEMHMAMHGAHTKFNTDMTCSPHDHSATHSGPI